MGMPQKDIKEIANQIADQLVDGGEYFECGGVVVYGWRIGSSGPNLPTEDAAELLLAQQAEIERLRKYEEALNVLAKQENETADLLAERILSNS